MGTGLRVIIGVVSLLASGCTSSTPGMAQETAATSGEQGVNQGGGGTADASDGGSDRAIQHGDASANADDGDVVHPASPNDGGDAVADAAMSGDSDAAVNAPCVVPIAFGPGPGPTGADDNQCEATLCRATEGYEIRVTHPSGFYIGALTWTLVVCDHELGIASLPGGDLNTLGFVIGASELSALEANAPLGIFYGPTPVGQPVRQGDSYRGFDCGRLDKDAVAECS